MESKGKSPIQAQADKLFKHTRSGSYATRARYKVSCGRFIDFVHETFKLKNLQNLQDKHVIAFIHTRQDDGIMDKTIKNDLGAIRYLHDMLPNTKHVLSDNEALSRQYDIMLKNKARGDRSWTEEEYHNAINFLNKFAHKSEKRTVYDVRDVLVVNKTMGLRIAEAMAMHRSQAEQALRTNIYQVKGEAKNGRHRQVPLSSEARIMFEERLQVIQRGQRMFILPEEQTHQAINRVEKYLERHRAQFETREGQERRSNNAGNNPLTFHGLRYNYVQERIIQEMSKGRSFRDGAKIVTKEVGHNRLEVIDKYLGRK